MAERRTFWPVVLVGVVSAGLTAVAGHHPWATAHGSRVAAFSTLDVAVEAGRVPGCTALALVVLACWGVVLVTRGRVRRVTGWLALLAALGCAAAVVLGFLGAPDGVRRSYAEVGVTDLDLHRTVWSYLALPLALLTVAAAAAGIRLMRGWPEMGRRYDAPADTAAAQAPDARVGAEQDDLGVWRAISEGRDPTA